jgi:hypothetical protein
LPNLAVSTASTLLMVVLATETVTTWSVSVTTVGVADVPSHEHGMVVDTKTLVVNG